MAMTRSESGTRGRLAWGLAIGSAILALLNAVYDLTLGNGWGDAILAVTLMLAVGTFGVVGATIASRTGNAVGWALLVCIGIFAVAGSAESYATFSLLDAAQPLPLTPFVAWLGTTMLYVTLPSILSIPLLYPTGTPQWRWVWRLYLAAIAVLIVGFAILPQELTLTANDVPGPPNPYAIETWGTPVGVILGIAAYVIVLCGALSIASLIVRFRRSHGEERQQIRWLAYVGIAAGVAFALEIVLNIIFGDAPSPGIGATLQSAAFLLFVLIILLGIPAACGVAVLKYRLYDLDIVIRKAVIFTLVTVTLTAVYLSVLALATLGNAPRLLVGLALLIVTFRPVQQAARSFADRFVYGKRASAYEVMTEFTGHVGETYATEEVLPRMARILAEGTGAATARVFLRLGSEQRSVASWPPDAVPVDDEILVPVLDQGEELGALGVTMPPNDPWDAPRERLVHDLASQAGLVLRNVRLIEELKASRQRLVAAQDEERRRLERNIHDGAQQQLVALAVKQRLLGDVIGRDDQKAKAMVDQLAEDTNDALEDLRDLARGIYPPLLQDKGMVAALEAQSRKATVPTTVEGSGIGRYSQDVEAAVYFCVLEAMNNVAKYAEATHVTIRIRDGDGSLAFRVVDDGRGFDPAATGYGTGLQGIADRLASLGGDVKMTSAPGAGTSISGQLPTGV